MLLDSGWFFKIAACNQPEWLVLNELYESGLAGNKENDLFRSFGFPWSSSLMRGLHLRPIGALSSVISQTFQLSGLPILSDLIIQCFFTLRCFTIIKKWCHISPNWPCGYNLCEIVYSTLTLIWFWNASVMTAMWTLSHWCQSSA